MLHVVLVEPEIPANTGNIARTCAATGSVLHLVKPLGFDISDKAVKRAGLDYWHLVDVRVYEDLDDFFAKNHPSCLRLFFPPRRPAATTRPITPTGPICSSARRPEACRRIFSPRTMTAVSASPSAREARSLNLSNSAAIGVFEALRQQQFPHLKTEGKMADWNR